MRSGEIATSLFMSPIYVVTNALSTVPRIERLGNPALRVKPALLPPMPFGFCLPGTPTRRVAPVGSESKANALLELV
jgi:hypothetical protein